MKLENIDFVSAGIIVAFEADTGTVFHLKEKLFETVDGKAGCKVEITDEECEEVREKVACAQPNRRVDAIIAPPDVENHDHDGPKCYAVDPMTRKLRVEILDHHDFPDGTHFHT